MSSNPESKIQNEVMHHLSQNGWTIWRQNVGLGWAGDVTRLEGGSILIRNPRPLRCGLCQGSSDLIGLRPVEITEEMIGSTIAQFVAIEVKGPQGRLSAAQRRFLDHVGGCGGVVMVTRSVEDIVE